MTFVSSFACTKNGHIAAHVWKNVQWPKCFWLGHIGTPRKQQNISHHGFASSPNWKAWHIKYQFMKICVSKLASSQHKIWYLKYVLALASSLFKISCNFQYAFFPVLKRIPIPPYRCCPDVAMLPTAALDVGFDFHEPPTDCSGVRSCIFCWKNHESCTCWKIRLLWRSLLRSFLSGAVLS